MNGYQEGYSSVAIFSIGGQESASKSPQDICKLLWLALKDDIANIKRQKNEQKANASKKQKRCNTTHKPTKG
jgi:hypothetical protein